MKRKNTFYGYAEDDFYFLKRAIENGNKGNAICSISQSIIERFLKQIIVNYIDDNNDHEEYSNILRAHNLKKIMNFICQNLNDFNLNRSIVMNCNGYYFDSRYPGNDSFFVNNDDIESYWDSVLKCKEYVDNYINNNPNKINEFRSE